MKPIEYFGYDDLMVSGYEGILLQLRKQERDM